MNSQPWTQREIARALSLYEEGLACAEIARDVGRSETALRLKLLSLGYSSRRVITGREERSAARTTEAAPVSLVGKEEEIEDTYLERARRELEVGERRRAERERVNEAKVNSVFPAWL